MRRVWIRPQIASALALAVLMVLAGSLLLTTPIARIHLSQGYEAQLAQWRTQGSLKQALHKQELAAALAAKAVPDCTQVQCIALTFDDGPNPLTTPQIVSILEAEQVPATFFMVGSRVAGNDALLLRMHNDGDEIGNHSWNHPNLTTLTAQQIQQQVQQTQSVIAAAGVPAPTLFRPPYGAVNQTVRDNVKPLTLALWNEDPKDWAASSVQQVLAGSETSAKAGGVSDLHDIYQNTADALKPLIDNLKSRQFQFVTMSQLMGQPPASGEFFGHY